MDNINDKSFRLAFTERFLDCDTTVEEERELARYYSRCKRNGCVPDGEKEICELVLATIKTADVPQCQPQRRRNVWLRIVGIAAAAVVAVALVMTFALTDRQPSTVASTTAAASHDTAAARIAAVAPTTLTTPVEKKAQPQQVNSIVSASSPNCTKVASVRHEEKTKTTFDNIDMAEVYSLAAALFHDMSNVLIERGSEGVMVSAVGENGKKQSFLVSAEGSGGLTMKAI